MLIIGMTLGGTLSPTQAGDVVKGPPYVPAKEDILFSCSFDESVDADTARGDGTCRIQGKGEPEFAAGRLGKGAVFKDGYAFQYQANGNVAKEGSLEMWVEPVVWKSEDAGGYGFFHWAPDSGNHLSLRIFNAGREDLNSVAVLARDGTGRLLQYASGIVLSAGLAPGRLVVSEPV